MTVLAMFFLKSNFGSSIKLIRNASIHLTEEPFLFFHNCLLNLRCLLIKVIFRYYLHIYTYTSYKLKTYGKEIRRII